MKVKVVSRIESFNQKSPEKLLISIGQNDNNYARFHDINDWKNMIVLYFDDVLETKGHPWMDVAMNEDQAEIINDFIEKYPDGDFIVHCDAGISRSAAVASFMEKWYDAEVKYTVTGTDKFKNVHVFNLLNRLKYETGFGEIE